MSDRSTGDLLIVLGVAVLALPVVVYVVLFLFVLGPTVWIVSGVLLVGIGLVLKGTDADRTGDGPGKTNCPACGARTELDRETARERPTVLPVAPEPNSTVRRARTVRNRSSGVRRAAKGLSGRLDTDSV